MGAITDRQMQGVVSKETWLTDPAPKGAGRFAARLKPGGNAAFYFRYTNESGKRDRLPIGSYDPAGRNGLTLKEARERSGELARLYQSGFKNIREHLEAEEISRKQEAAAKRVQLALLKEEAKHAAAALAARMTVADLFEHWILIEVSQRKNGAAEMRRSFGKDVLPVIGGVFVEDVKKANIMQVVDPILARGTNRMAKVVFSSLRQMFRFAVDRDIIEHDPTAAIRKAKIGGKDTERDRVLTEDEIRTLARQMPDAGLLPTTEAAVWIALSTCCRIGELLAARWEHIDLERMEWTIPAENSKNGKPHTVYLSRFAAEQFRRVQAYSGHIPWIYPNTKDTGPVCAKTITKQLTDRQREPGTGSMTRRSAKTDALVLPGSKWTAHDLRRTGATLMTQLGVLPEVAERCLNHTEENKVKRIYQRHNYAGEMREAWRLLGERLELLTNANLAHISALRIGGVS